MRIVDLTQKLSIMTPPWPSYEPLQVKFFKRLMPNGASGQIITTSNHVGTHMDGEIHFCTHGRTIGNQPLEDFVGPGVVVDISDEVEDFSIYTPEMLMKKADIRKGDILIINTGYHRYGWDQPEADEIRYMVRHPGPSREYVEWCKEMQFKWIGVDCGSADHPMNTILRKWSEELYGLATECSRYFQKKYGKTLEEIFPRQDYQMMHFDLFPKGIIHAENVGGDIDQLSNQRTYIGAFPWRAIELESCICRIVAFPDVKE